METVHKSVLFFFIVRHDFFKIFLVVWQSHFLVVFNCCPCYDCFDAKRGNFCHFFFLLCLWIVIAPFAAWHWVKLLGLLNINLPRLGLLLWIILVNLFSMMFQNSKETWNFDVYKVLCLNDISSASLIFFKKKMIYVVSCFM